MELGGGAHTSPFLPTFISSSPIAFLVGAAVSSQVKDEKALGEFICSYQSRGMRFSYPPSSPKPLPLHTAPAPWRVCCQDKQREMGVERREGPPGTYSVSQGESVPTQLQFFYQILRKVQKLEVWEVTEVFHLPDLVSCQRQEAVGEGRVQRKS